MERIKALLAVSFFVAALIFANPIIVPEAKIVPPSQKKMKISIPGENDSLNNNYYTYKPNSNPDFITK